MILDQTKKSQAIFVEHWLKFTFCLKLSWNARKICFKKLLFLNSKIKKKTRNSLK